LETLLHPVVTTPQQIELSLNTPGPVVEKLNLRRSFGDFVQLKSSTQGMPNISLVFTSHSNDESKHIGAVVLNNADELLYAKFLTLGSFSHDLEPLTPRMQADALLWSSLA
jgi:hypothetical protein